MEDLKHRVKGLLRHLKGTIKRGPLKGFKWILSSGKKFIDGVYEEFKVEVFAKHLDKGDTLIDVGGHVGYFTCIGSILVGDQGRVITFEPRPLNHGFLKEHLRINNITNVDLYDKGVARSAGTRHFNINTGTGTGHISEDGELKIEVISLDDDVASGRIPTPDFIKIDVEGGEIEVLQGSEKTISEHRPKILVATHGDETHRFVINFLEKLNYKYEILNPDAVRGDTEIMALP